MKILLDTCSIIWTISEPSVLSPKAAQLIESTESQIYVSPISCAEIACLAERGRIVLNQHWKVWFNHYLNLNCWKIKDINLAIIQESYSLPDSFHQDPADRIITATARIHNLTVITADKKILNYPHVDTVW